MICAEKYREHIEYTFYAFCKIVIRNARYTALRTRRQLYVEMEGMAHKE